MLEANISSETNAPRDDSATWLSVGDLMSVLLLLLALVLITTLIKITEELEANENTRVIIIQTLQSALNKDGIKAEVNPETGDVSIFESVLFDSNESSLKTEGEAFLQNFIPQYSEILAQTPGALDVVVRVIIEGHTDSTGSDAFNMNLSLDRAFNVYNFINNKDFPFKDEFIEKLLISGRGELDANQEIPKPSDRKVKFRIQFKGASFKANRSELSSKTGLSILEQRQ